MKKFNVITSLAVDENDSSFNYQLYYINNKKKREIYWKCCVVFFASSKRFNPTANHILYTNDTQPIVVQGLDIWKYLKDLGVEIRVLPFEKFAAPKKFSTYHNLTLYNLDVIDQIAQEPKEYNNLFLDSDIIWIKGYESILPLFENENLIIYDIYRQKDVDSKKHNISRRDLGNTFKEIDPEYPEEFPKRYGGEILGGSTRVFENVAAELGHYYNYILSNFEHAPKIIDKKIFDGDEFILSMVYNKLKNSKNLANQFIKRVWTNENVGLDDPKLFDLTMWHLIAEKMTGISMLYEDIIDEKSEFWKVPISKLAQYQGYYFGIPERRFEVPKEKTYQTFVPKVINKIKEKVNNLLYS